MVVHVDSYTHSLEFSQMGIQNYIYTSSSPKTPQKKLNFLYINIIILLSLESNLVPLSLSLSLTSAKAENKLQQNHYKRVVFPHYNLVVINTSPPLHSPTPFDNNRIRFNFCKLVMMMYLLYNM